MSKVFDLYGIVGLDINTAATLLGEALGVSFEPHESSFWGDYYVARDKEDWTEKFSLKENFNEMEDDWNEPEFQEYPLILEVVLQSVPRAHEVEELLKEIADTKVILLRRNEYPKEEKKE